MIRRLINAIVWLLVAGSVAIILGGLLGRPVLVAAVPTGSMVPVLRPGDLIPIAPLFGAVPKSGQVIVFKTPRDNTWIVHRIVGGNAQDGFTTRGDANPGPDPNPVHLGDIAGFVPRVGGWVMRVPNLGSISLGRGPLSSPITAAAALLLGVYLLLADSGSWLQRTRRMRLKRAQRLRLSNATVVYVYVGLGAVVSAMTLLTTLSLAVHEEARYDVVPTRIARISDSRITALSEVRTDSVSLRNPSWIPLVVHLASNDADLQWEPQWLTLPGKSSRTVALVRHSQVLGSHKVQLRQSYYLPLLPVSVLQALAAGGWFLPACAISLVPLIPVLGLAASDYRVKVRMRKLWLHLRLRT